jgi:hypothetical protein
VVEVKAIRIPASTGEPLEVVSINGLKDMQSAVGGLVEFQDIDSPNASLVFNEEGKIEDLPMNRRATLLWWIHKPMWRNSDVLAGDVLIVGEPDDEGNTTDVPDELVSLLLKTKVYKIEVVTTAKETFFIKVDELFEQWVDAYYAGIRMLDKFDGIAELKVVPA